MGDQGKVPPPDGQSPGAWTCFKRGLRLRCPECGISPIFVPISRVRGTWDWFTPLDGCPRCGYAYERESGYFLLAIWGLNYGLIAGLGTAALFILDWTVGLTLKQAILFATIAMPLASFLFARHAKSLYLAMDHYFDPHVRRPGAEPDIERISKG